MLPSPNDDKIFFPVAKILKFCHKPQKKPGKNVFMCSEHLLASIKGKY